MSDVNKNLNEILDIEPIESEDGDKLLTPGGWSNLPPLPEVRRIEPTQEVVVSRPMLQAPDPDTQETKDDFTHGRDVYRELIEKGTDAIDELTKVAKASEEPRAYEVVAALIKTTAETTKELLDLHRRHKNLTQDTTKKAPQVLQEQPNINVERAVFVGTTKDLLNKVKQDSGNFNTGNS